jgi:folate-binding protein YgfZ
MSGGLEAMHDAAGARWSDGDVRVPRNYGDPGAEYDAARSDVVVIERSDRSFVRVHGRDPVKMVQGLISNDIANAPANRAVYATVLTPKGKMVADVRVLRHEADLLMETDVAAAEPLTAHLRKFVPPLFAKFEDANAAWTEIGIYGPRAAEVVAKVFDIEAAEAATAAEDVLFDGAFEGGSLKVVATAYAGVSGFDVVMPAGGVERVWAAIVSAGARPAGHATLDVLRIEAGSPRWGAELTETTIPLEAGLRDRAISQSKGCYTGQEVIVRILHRGHVNWILRRLLLGDASAPAPGAELVNEGGKKVGRITSAAWSPKYGQTVALGYVRREVELGTQVRVGTAAATVADAEPIVQNDPARHGSSI